jgi:prephenate dehydrogenase
VIDTAAPDIATATEDADLIVLAGPPLACLGLLDVLPDSAATRSTVTDVASTKAAIVGRADARGLRFVGGHPMAGREAVGFDAAVPDLFVDRPWVVTPGDRATEADIERVEWLATSCGARPIRLGPIEHDEAVAAISHLPLVLAATLVEAVTGATGHEPAGRAIERTLAASGWRDMTRLARGDVAMGAGIASTNADALARRIRDVMAVLDGWLEDLEADGGPDAERLAARFRSARDELEGGGA